MKKKLTFALIAVGLASLLAAGEDFNGIYLGYEAMYTTGKVIAVQITEDGTVTAFKGSPVPGFHDRYGNQVVIKRIVLK